MTRLLSSGGRTFTNPSICSRGDYTIRTVREVNYKIDFWSGRYIAEGDALSSSIWMAQTRHDSQNIEFKELRNQRSQKFPLGLEDARVFIWRGQVWAVCSAASWQDGQLDSKIVLTRIDAGEVAEIVELPSPHGHRREKNWAPIVDGDSLYLVYDVNALEIYRWDGQHLSLHKAGEPSQQAGRRLSGSSQFVRWGRDGGYLGVAHASTPRPRRLLGFPSRIYSHVFIYLNADLSLARTSKPFVFRRRGVEFCAGLMPKSGTVHVTFGSADQFAYEVEITKARVLQLLHFPVESQGLR